PRRGRHLNLESELMNARQLLLDDGQRRPGRAVDEDVSNLVEQQLGNQDPMRSGEVAFEQLEGLCRIRFRGSRHRPLERNRSVADDSIQNLRPLSRARRAWAV